MADIWDLGRYVEDHPDEYDQRWRLAKKLYLACEYRLALEHLQILRNDWERRLNVIRYLSATLYRLGRYDEAIGELHEAIETWPGEVGLREQLARVLEVAGRPHEAAEVWERLSELDPGHAIAARAVSRLRNAQEKGEAFEEDLHLEESDSGIDLAPKIVCPTCGAQNSAEFESCWQCQAPLMPENQLARPRTPVRIPRPEPALRLLGAGVVIVVMAFGAYSALASIPPTDPALPSVVPLSVYAALFERLVTARIAVGAVLLAAWPIVLMVALRMVPSDAPGGGAIAIVGLVNALLAFGALWAPMHLWPMMAVLLAITSLLLIAILFRVTPRDAFVVWLLQAVFIVVVAGVAFGAVEGFMSLLELPAAVRFAAVHDGTGKPVGAHAAPEGTVSAKYTIEWASSGSRWLDRELENVAFRIDSDTQGSALTFDLVRSGTATAFEPLGALPSVVTAIADANTPYEINVRGGLSEQGKPVSLTIYSVLTPRVALAANAPPEEAGGGAK